VTFAAQGFDMIGRITGAAVSLSLAAVGADMAGGFSPEGGFDSSFALMGSEGTTTGRAGSTINSPAFGATGSLAAAGADGGEFVASLSASADTDRVTPESQNLIEATNPRYFNRDS